MKNIPVLQNKAVEILFTNRTITNEQLEEILLCEKAILTEDLLSIVQFCNNDIEEIDETISDNCLYYALFLLKEINSENQLDLILDILKWSDDQIQYWLGDMFVDYYWCLIYHFGEDQIENLVVFLKQEKIETFCKEQIALALYQFYLKNPDKQKNISDFWTELLEYYNTIPEENENIDSTYLAFFVSYIYQPNNHQKELIKNLYDKGYIDLTINGGYDELFEIIESEREIRSVFDLYEEFAGYENMNQLYQKIKVNGEYENLKRIQTPKVLEKKFPRNEPCPCGSGKKHKKCCLN
jgi:hypothetical protein